MVSMTDPKQLAGRLTQGRSRMGRMPSYSMAGGNTPNMNLANDMVDTVPDAQTTSTPTSGSFGRGRFGGGMMPGFMGGGGGMGGGGLEGLLGDRLGGIREKLDAKFANMPPELRQYVQGLVGNLPFVGGLFGGGTSPGAPAATPEASNFSGVDYARLHPESVAYMNPEAEAAGVEGMTAQAPVPSQAQGLPGMQGRFGNFLNLGGGGGGFPFSFGR